MSRPGPDFRDIRGLEPAIVDKLVQAARDGSPVLLEGSPATMIGRRFCGLLPDPDEQTWQEQCFLYAAAGVNAQQTFGAYVPFRAPHHTVSGAAMRGTLANLEPTESQRREDRYRRLHHPFTAPRRIVKPGELSLAHGGVLFLDEVPEFSIGTLEAIANAYRDREVALFRRDVGWVRLPARFHLVMTAHPPAGSRKAVEAYQARLARMLERIAGPVVRIELPPRTREQLTRGKRWPSTAELRARI